MSYIPSVSQVEFSRQAKAPQPTCRALLRQRTTSAERDKSTQSGSNVTVTQRGRGGKIQGRGVRRTPLSNLQWGQWRAPFRGGGSAKSGAGRSFGLEDQDHVEGEGGCECSLLVSPLHTVWVAGEVRSESAKCRCLKSSAASKGIPSEPESTGRQEAMAGGQVYQVEGPGSPFVSRKMHSRVMRMEF